MIYANRPLFKNPTGWQQGTLNVLDSNGHVTLTTAEGLVLSVQPDGSFETRPAGTAGAYEVAVLSGDKLIYNPGTPYVIAMVA